ncbi:MAG: FAD-dependent oxidoreductase [Chloroflexi bacterium]|nr:FAD-dependent oxidoreductase [Chloroflexota bacterium]MCL5026006.1 FAD-dependent oxidoreductase [Chloroflexota bacterium]
MTVQLRPKYQVVVAGGGTAGVVAAIAAARTGARTLLVEHSGFVGGVAAMGIPFHGFYNNSEDHIVKGIPWEIVSRLREMDACADIRNIGVGEPRGRGSLKFNARWVVYHPEAYKYVALEMLREAGVELMLHTYVSDVIVEDGALAGLVVENKSGRVAIPASQVVDCTGDADIAARAGAPFERGRPGDGATQPVTPLFILSNVDIERMEKAGVHRWPYEAIGSEAWRSTCACYNIRPDRWADDLHRDIPQFAPILKQFNMWNLGDGVYYAGNMLHIPKVDASNADELSRAEVDARLMVWRLVQFAREHVPGFENTHLVSVAASIGIRETRRIVGEYALTYDDVIEARRFDDVIALCGYRVDIHGYDGGMVYNEPERGTQVKGLGSYAIPFRSLVPKLVDNVVVAGRSLSASHEAQGSARVMGTCMAMGQAAGTAAALSAQRNIAPRRLDVRLLQDTLRQQGAYLGERGVEASPPLPSTG